MYGQVKTFNKRTITKLLSNRHQRPVVMAAVQKDATPIKEAEPVSTDTTVNTLNGDNGRFRHYLPLQLRFNDVDKFGHVNNTVYFQFYDTAKTEYISQVCPDVDWKKEAIVVAHIEADFLSQIKAGCRIAARTRVSRIGRKSFHLYQEIIDTNSKEVKCRCMSVMVVYDLHRQTTKKIPESWVKSISEYEGIDGMTSL